MRPPYGRDFWPRTRRPDIAAEFDFDRPCGNCGYNLRGLPLRTPCPECGSIGGINLTDETVPWDQRANLVSFIGTILLVLFRPHTFARLVWSPERFDALAARRFRRWTLIVAVAVLGAVAMQITVRAVGLAAALWALPFDLAAFTVWFNSVSLEPIAFVKGTGSPVVRRAEVLAHYTSAALATAPLHLLLLLFSLQLLAIPEIGWLIAAGVHLVLLFGQLLMGVNATSCMFYELVDLSHSRALGYTLMRAMTAVGAAVPMLVGVPALAAAVASKSVGG